MSFKDEILRWPRDRQMEWHERAAIKEYDAGMSRAKAEYEAWREIKREMEQAA